jgi:hypothetical protein
MNLVVRHDRRGQHRQLTRFERFEPGTAGLSPSPKITQCCEASNPNNPLGKNKMSSAAISTLPKRDVCIFIVETIFTNQPIAFPRAGAAVP